VINLPVPGPFYKWQEVGKVGVACWCIFFAWTFYMYWSGTPYLQNAFLIPHEAGHLLFSYSQNETLTIFGGTILEVTVPFLLLASFAWRGHTYGTAFCGYMFFTSFQGVGIYMADARARALPLVSPGVASDEIEGHDWAYIFNWFGVIQRDVQIGNFTRAIGYIGMVAMVAWLVYMWRRSEEGSLEEDRFFASAG
jgi:hypothetical protein